MMVSMMNWWTTPKTRRKAGGWERPVSPRETIIGIGIGIGIQTEKSGYNPTITPYHDQSLYSLQCHDLTACRARCIRILELLLDFELRRTVEEPKNQKTFFPGFWFPGPGNRCRDVSGDSKSTREPVLKEFVRISETEKGVTGLGDSKIYGGRGASRSACTPVQ